MLSTVAEPTPTRKRRKHTRKATGCRECRRQHVRCAEGVLLPSGRRSTCKRCWQLDQACFYPTNGRVRKGELALETWEEAEGVDEWVGAEVEVLGEVAAATTPDAADGRKRKASADSSTTSTAPPVGEGIIELPLPDAVKTQTLALSRTTTSSRDAPTTAVRSPWLSTDLWRSVLTPSPAKPLSTFTLAALHSSPIDRQVVSYFETQGCNEIVAVSTYQHNWIFKQLFPRLFAIFLEVPGVTAMPVDMSIRDWLRNSLLHLAYVHRGNVEMDEPKSWYWRSEAGKYRQLASYSLLKAKVHCEGDEWKTEEYL